MCRDWLALLDLRQMGRDFHFPVTEALEQLTSADFWVHLPDAKSRLLLTCRPQRGRGILPHKSEPVRDAGARAQGQKKQR